MRYPGVEFARLIFRGEPFMIFWQATLPNLIRIKKGGPQTGLRSEATEPFGEKERTNRALP